MANGRITYKEIYGMQAEVKAEISGCRERLAGLESKQDDIADDVKALFDTVKDHTEKIGVIRGKLIVWGIIGGGGISMIIIALSKVILG